MTDEDSQEATIRAYHRVNPGIIISGTTRTVTKSHFEFCVLLCSWQQNRGALYIMILTDPEDALSEEQFLALETLHRNEGSAWLGQDLRQMGTGARLDSKLPTMSRVHVWTNSFTMAEEHGRADEAAEAEIDEETPSPDQQRQLLRAHVNLGDPTIGEFCRALRSGRCKRGVVRWAKRYLKCPECESLPMPRTRPAASLPKCYRFNQVCGIDTLEVRKPLDRENPIPNIARH